MNHKGRCSLLLKESLNLFFFFNINSVLKLPKCLFFFPTSFLCNGQMQGEAGELKHFLNTL